MVNTDATSSGSYFFTANIEPNFKRSGVETSKTDKSGIVMTVNQSLQKQIILAANRQSFLLRIWRENGRSPWRFMVQSVNDSKRYTFTTLEAFLAHLETCLND